METGQCPLQTMPLVDYTLLYPSLKLDIVNKNQTPVIPRFNNLLVRLHIGFHFLSGYR